MPKRIGRTIVMVLAVVFLVTGGLYVAGLRLELDGGGGFHLRFRPSARSQAEQLSRHREAQRGAPLTAAGRPAELPDAAPAATSDGRLGAPAGDDDAVSERRPAPVATPAVRHAEEDADWTDFRGARRDGHYDEQPVRTDWPAGGLTPVWKQPVGGGYASFVVAHGRAFTIEQRGDEEVAAAYDVATGRELWTDGWRATFRERMGGDGPRATPTWADGRVYVLGGTGELRCLDDADGRVLWRTNILSDARASNLQWGMAAAPLVVDDTVVVLPGGRSGQSVVAYDRTTGARVWSALDDQQSYSSPMLVTLAGVRQILVFSASRLVGLSTDGQRVLWEYPWKTNFDINASQPLVVGDNRVFVSTGYGTGAAVIEITPAGSAFDVREVWRNIRMKNQFTSSVLHDGHIYGLDESILACIDAATGDLKWKGGRYGYGQVLLASGHLIVLTEGGRARPRPCDADQPPGAGAPSGHRGQDLEPSGDEQWVPPRPEHRRDGGLRSAAVRSRRAGMSASATGSCAPPGRSVWCPLHPRVA